MAVNSTPNDEKICSLEETHQGTANDAQLCSKYLTEIHELLTKAKSGKFKEVCDVLNRRPHFINCIPDVRAWGVLHQAVYFGNEQAVLIALGYPACDPFLKTNQDIKNVYGPGRTPDELFRDNISILGIVKKAQDKYKFAQDNRSHILLKNSSYRITDGLKMQQLGESILGDDWESVIALLKRNNYLINAIDPNSGLAPLHKAVLNEKPNVISQLIAFPFSNPKIETMKNSMNIHGPGKSPQQLTDSEKITNLITEKLQELSKHNLVLPIRILPWRAGVLVTFFLKVVESFKGILCPAEMMAPQEVDLAAFLHAVFNHVNSGNNWMLAKQEVTFQLRNVSIEYSQMLDEFNVMNEEKPRFFARIVQIYTQQEHKAIYPELNSLFHSLQKTKEVDSNLELGTYALLLNALLLYWEDLNEYTGKTYRGVILNSQDLSELVKDYEFVSLNFMSCSRKEVSPKYESAECMVVIDNSAKCIWSPKHIGMLATKPDGSEYLYPIGARFKVIDSAPNYINIKLIPPD